MSRVWRAVKKLFGIYFIQDDCVYRHNCSHYDGMHCPCDDLQLR